MRTYVIGDIAGNYLTLLELVRQFKPPYRIVALGDVIDRGPRSKEVIEFLRSSPRITTLMGNHEWICLNDIQCWKYNGGMQTLESFGGSMPEDVLKWMRKLPWAKTVKIGKKVFTITHAPIPDPNGPVWSEEPLNLWNRYPPARIEGVDLQVFGHNARGKAFADHAGTYAMCIDDSATKTLQAIELPSMRILEQPYIDDLAVEGVYTDAWG